MIPMNASDSCLVLPLPRDTKDIGDLSDTIAYSGSMIRCYIELLRLFCFRQFSCTNKSFRLRGYDNGRRCVHAI